MHPTLRRFSSVAALGALAALGIPTVASAQGALGGSPAPLGPPPQEHAVFVQTDNLAGNAIDVLAEHPDGRLSLQETVPTGGLGGQTAGSVADRLASQDSLVYDRQDQLLFAVNAGSDSLSVFSVQGQELHLLQVVSSGGDFPDSIAVFGDLVYVLDSGGSGAVTGYRVVGLGRPLTAGPAGSGAGVGSPSDRLVSLPGSSRTLGLSNATPPFFLSSPAQIGFSPNGSELIVTTKGSTSSFDVFAVSPAGLLSAVPAVTADGGAVPFAFTFSSYGQLVVAEAANSTLHTYALGRSGSLTSLSASVPDGQSALCWVTAVGSHYYAANAGSNTVSAYTVAPDGTPSLVGATGVVATTDSGPIDMAASADGSTLYVEAGAAGAVDEFHVNGDGSLGDLGSVAGLGAGIEGIATD